MFTSGTYQKNRNPLLLSKYHATLITQNAKKLLFNTKTGGKFQAKTLSKLKSNTQNLII